jgi:hypothetical protein
MAFALKVLKDKLLPEFRYHIESQPSIEIKGEHVLVEIILQFNLWHFGWQTHPHPSAPLWQSPSIY